MTLNNESTPRVSVIVPAYNVERQLDACLTSLCAQTERSIEILVINDGSTDQTGAVAERWRAKDSRIRLITTENQGASVARNIGFENAHGQYIAIQDADDYSHPTRFQHQIRALDEDPELSLVGTWAFLTSAENQVLGMIKPPTTAEVVKHQLQTRIAYVHASLMFRRELVDEGMRYDPTLPSSEDWDMLSRATTDLNGRSIDKPLYFYRMTSGQLTQRFAVAGALHSVWVSENTARRRRGEDALAIMPKYPTRDDALAAGLSAKKVDASVYARFENLFRMNRMMNTDEDKVILIAALKEYQQSLMVDQEVKFSALFTFFAGTQKRRTLTIPVGRDALKNLITRDIKYRAHVLKTRFKYRRWFYIPDVG